MDKSLSKKDERLNDVDINEIIKPYLKKWWWFVLSVLLCLAFAVYYLKKTSPIYKVQSTVLIKDSRRAPSMEMGALSQLGGFGSSGASSVENEIEILKSKKLFHDVVKELQLQTSLISIDGLRKNILYKESAPAFIQVVTEKKVPKPLKGPIKLTITGDKLVFSGEDLPADIITTYKKLVSLPYANIIVIKNPAFVPPKKPLGTMEIAYMSEDGAVDSFQGMTSVELVNKDATVVALSLNYANPEKAKDIIDKLVDSYNNDAITDKSSESKRTRDFIDERIGIIADELGEVESRKEQFKVANNITDIPTEASYSYSGMEQSRARLLETETQLALADDLVNYMNNLGAKQTMPASVGLSNPLAAQSINTYNQLVLERNRLLENATPQNPLIIDLNKQISVLRGSVLDALKTYKTSLVASRNQIQGQKNSFVARVSKIPAQEKLFRSIERQQTIKENLYLLLLQKREEAAISLAITSPKARIIDSAFSSPFPVAPRRMFVYLISIFIGLLIPFAYIYLKRLFDNKVWAKRDVEKLSNIPILGEIPTLENSKSDLIQLNDLSSMAEAFRILTTNVNYILKKSDSGKVVFVTSTTKGEGKTFISVNYASALANPKVKVVIIGADIRNPQLQRYNPQSKSLLGFSEYLYDQDITLSEVIHKSPMNPNLDVIYSGSIPPNPTELLKSDRYGEMIEELKAKYDYVVVDTAPLLLVTDTFLSADLADATVYVVRSGYTEKPLIEFANHQIEDDKLKNVGFVLNAVNKEHFGYGNKYGYGYGVDNRSFWEKLMDKLRFRS